MASAGVNSDYHKSDPFAPAESARSMEERDEKRYHNRYRSLLFGQVLSLLTTGTAVCTSVLTRYTELTAPVTQIGPTYPLLSMYLLLTPRQQHREKVKGAAWWPFFLMALIDVEANVLVVWAYQYTSITSAMLIDCFTIPSVMLLSKLFLNAKYTKTHFIGAVLCLLGLGCIVLSDAYLERDSDGTYPHAVFGDILCFCGSFLYASSNVLQEHWVKHAGPYIFLGRVGLFGTAICIVQAFTTERQALLSASTYSTTALSAWAGFVACMVLVYGATSEFLVIADAAMFNLSLLTSDLYAVIFAYFFTGKLVSWLYFVAFALTLSGLVVYHRAPPATMADGWQSLTPSDADTHSPLVVSDDHEAKLDKATDE